MKTVEGFILRSLAKEYIITAENIRNVDFNKLISLNESAAYLWKEVEGKEFDADTLADLLVERYDIDRETAFKDSVAIIEKWKEAGIAVE